MTLLTFGVPGETPLDFTPFDSQPAREKQWATLGYAIEVLGKDAGTSFTNAEATLETFTSSLYDGQAVDISGWSAASEPIYVQVTGPDSGGLTSGCAALTTMCRRKGLRELTWYSPDGASAPTVFDVLVVTQALQFDDQDEVANQRTYALTMTCKPSPRSQDQVTMTASGPLQVPTVTQVDAATSVTNWSAPGPHADRVNLMPTSNFWDGAPGWSLSSNSAGLTLTGPNLQWTTNISTVGANVLISSPMVRVVAGLAYTVSMQATARTGSAGGVLQMGLMRRFYNASGTQVGSDLYTATTGVGLTPVQLKLVNTIAPAGATRMRVFPFFQSTGGIAYPQISDVMVEQASSVGSYFNGDMTDCAWVGAPGNSESMHLVAASTVDLSAGHVHTKGPWTSSPLSAVSLERTFSTALDLSTMPIVRITGIIVPGPSLMTNTTSQFLLTSSSGFTWLTPARLDRTPTSTGAGSFIAYFQSPVASVADLRLQVTGAGAASADLTITDLTIMSGLPAFGTARQGLQSIPMVGTMPAEVELTVDNGVDGSGTMYPLGQHTVIYTRPSDPALAAPPLRQYRISSGAESTAPDSLSGFTETLGTTQATAFWAEIPASAVAHATHLFVAWLSATGLTVGSSYVLNWQTFMNDDATPSGASTPNSTMTGTRVITATATTFAFQPTQVGEFTLPSRVVETTGTYGATVNVRLWVTGGGTWTLDEGHLFDVDNGQLSVVSTTENFNRLDIMPASADKTNQRYVTTATAADGSTLSREAQPAKWARHLADPAASAQGALDVFVASTAATPHMTISASYYPRWDVFAAYVDQQQAA